MWPPNSPDLNPVDYVIWSVTDAGACVPDQSAWHWRAATASYHRVVWTGTAHCGWRHWSVATSSVSLDCFLILHGMMLTHALWKKRHFLYSEMPSSFLVNTLQTLSKSAYNCQSYWQKFRGTFFCGPLCTLSCSLPARTMSFNMIGSVHL